MGLAQCPRVLLFLRPPAPRVTRFAGSNDHRCLAIDPVGSTACSAQDAQKFFGHLDVALAGLGLLLLLLQHITMAGVRSLLCVAATTGTCAAQESTLARRAKLSPIFPVVPPFPHFFVPVLVTPEKAGVM